MTSLFGPELTHLSRSALTTLLLVWALPGFANWQLDNAASQLSFVTIKAGNIGEVHHFRKLNGSINNEGNASVEIVLASIDTLIPIRDERMQSMLFEADIFPVARIEVPFEKNALAGLTPGSMSENSLVGQLQIKDRQIEVTAHVTAMRVGEKRIVVATRQPILVSASMVGLEAGVEKLREVAGLPSISQAVPVTFLLTFVQE